MNKISPTASPDPLYDTPTAAQYLGVIERTLERWRSKNKGPTYIKLGGTIGAPVRYRQSALNQFLTMGEVNPAPVDTSGLPPRCKVCGCAFEDMPGEVCADCSEAANPALEVATR
jgi:hypothetical protein